MPDCDRRRHAHRRDRTVKQQVNLYQPIFRHRRPLFSALALLQVVGMIALGLGAVYGYSAWRTK